MISPVDAGIITQLPVIQFKLKNPAIHSVSVSVGNYRTKLDADQQGVYTFNKIIKLKPGFCMVIVARLQQRKQLLYGVLGIQLPSARLP